METEKWTILTGATGGLGKAFLNGLISKNKNVIICGTNKQKLEQSKSSYTNCTSKIICYAFNLADTNQILQFADFIKTNNFCVKTLINNAGFITEGSIEYSSYHNFINAIDVNCKGTILLTKQILNLNKYKNTNIITISSLASNYPMPYMSIYSATKSLLTSFFLSLRSELKKSNVNVTIVEPGAIPTSEDMINAIKAQGFKGKLSSTSAQKIARISLIKNSKHKKFYTPGFVNKLTKIASKITPKSLQMKVISKMWKKSQEKRNIK